MIAGRNSSRLVLNPSRIRSRRGAAAVEFAVCLPMLAALVFGTIESANAIFLQQALTASAFEAGNVACAIGGTSDNATSRAYAVLSALGVNGATVTISPVVTTDTPVGTVIVVNCSAPLGANAATQWCLGNTTLQATFTIPHM